jgi:hypothetical protein
MYCVLFRIGLMATFMLLEWMSELWADGGE